MIDKVLLEGKLQRSISSDYALPSGGMFPNWIAQYKKWVYYCEENKRDHLKWDINVSILHIMEKLIIKQRISFNASFRWLQQQNYRLQFCHVTELITSKNDFGTSLHRGALRKHNSP